MTDNTTHREKALALVVDDDLSLRVSICAALAKAGFETVEAENGFQAIDVFKKNRPDIIKPYGDV